MNPNMESQPKRPRISEPGVEPAIAMNPFHAALAEARKYLVSFLYSESNSASAGASSETSKKRKREEEPIEVLGDAFIHGSTSLSLPGLQRTDWTLSSPFNMVSTVYWAPEGGEITGGGHRGLRADCLPCFGRLSSYGVYDLEKIISYAQSKTFVKPVSDEKLILSLKKMIQSEVKYGFYSINVFLVYLGRAQQRGFDIFTQVFESRQQAELFQAQLNALSQVYAALLLLGDTLIPNRPAITNLSKEEKKNFLEAIRQTFTLEYLIEKILESNLDVKDVLQNPTKEGLTKVLDLFDLPVRVALRVNFNEESEFGLKVRNPFRLSTIAKYPKGKPLFYDSPEAVASCIVDNTSRGIGLFLEQVVENWPNKNFMMQFKELIRKSIKSAEQRVAALKGLYERDPVEARYTPQDKYFINRPIPIVYCVKSNHEAIKVFNSHSGEYRAERPLKLGDDISVIATDTEEHRGELDQFLGGDQRPKVPILLFTDLRQMKEDLNTEAPPLLDTALSL